MYDIYSGLNMMDDTTLGFKKTALEIFNYVVRLLYIGLT